jgi:hypothetical protein
MKKISFVALVLCICTLAIQSCKKDKELTALEALDLFQTGQDASESESLSNASEIETDVEVELRGGPNPPLNCPTITWANPQGTFPNTLTIDYGTGCVGPNGNVRKGIVIINQSAEMTVAGATRIRTHQNFYINNKKIEGTKTTTYNGLNPQGQPNFTRTHADFKVTFPDGEFVTFNATHTVTKTAGIGTPTMLDDTYSTTGNSSGVNRNGKAFTATITEPIIRNATCPWAQDGVRVVTREDKTVTIDYGYTEDVNSACDSKGMLTLPNGNTKVINLH